MKSKLAIVALLASCATCSTVATRGDATAHDDPAHWVAGIGSSSMYGVGASVAPFLNVLVDSLGSPPWLLRNEAAPGIDSTDCLDRWRTMVRGHEFGTIVLMCGVNDLRAGRSAEATWATLRRILDEALSDRLRVVPVTLQPFQGDGSWTPAKQRELLALNASILSYCQAKRLVCVDAYALLNDPGRDGALRAQYDSGDHLHFNQAAHDLLARGALAAFR